MYGVKVTKSEVIIPKPGRGRATYEIPLDRCQTLPQVMNWLAQVSVKTWMQENPGLFLEVFDTLKRVCPFDFHNPPWGPQC